MPASPPTAASIDAKRQIAVNDNPSKDSEARDRQMWTTMDSLSENAEKNLSLRDVIRYKKAFTGWINTRLASSPMPMQVDDLFVDAARVLYMLVAVLSRGTVAQFGKPAKDSHLQNVCIALEFLSRSLCEGECLPAAAKVVEGEPHSILSLAWWIISHYDGFDGFTSTPATFKSLALQWATHRAVVAGLTTASISEQQPQQYDRFAWNDECIQHGHLFLAVLHATDPSRFPFDPDNHDSRDNLAKAFERACTVYQVPPLLDADDDPLAFMQHEALVLMYISELRLHLPRLREPLAGGPPLPLGRIWPPQPPVFDDHRYNQSSKPSVQAAKESCPALPFWPPPHSQRPMMPSDTNCRTNGESASCSEIDGNETYVDSGSTHNHHRQNEERDNQQRKRELLSEDLTDQRDAIEQQDQRSRDRIRSSSSTDPTWTTKKKTLTVPFVEKRVTAHFKQKPTRVVFEQAAKALIHGARSMSKSYHQMNGELSSRRQLFAKYICSVMTAEKLELLWEARNTSSMTSLRESLLGIGVDNDKDLNFLTELLSDPFAMGDAPQLESKTFFDAWVSPKRRLDAATVITDRLSLPLARKGLSIYAKRIGESASVLWRAREEGGFCGLETALKDKHLFGETDVTARSVFAAMLMKPAVLPYFSNVIDELVARGMVSVASFASEHELALCAARETGGRAAVARVAKALSVPWQKDVDNTASTFTCSKEDKPWRENDSAFSKLATIIGDSRRFPTWRSRFDSRAARPPLLRIRAAKIWLKALARHGMELVRREWGGEVENQRCPSRSDTARILHAVLAVFDHDGIKAGDYDDCVHSKGSRVQARSRAFEIGYKKYGAARLDAKRSGLSTLSGIDDDSQILLCIYACDLCAKLPKGFLWKRLQEDEDDRSYELDYSSALVEFARLHIAQNNNEDVFGAKQQLESYDVRSTLGDGVGLLLLLKSLERFQVDRENLLLCPRPSGNNTTDLVAAAEFAHSVWGVPRIFLLETDNAKFRNDTKRERVEAFFTELLLRLPDEAFDEVLAPTIALHDQESHETTSDVNIIQYTRWCDFVFQTYSRAPSTVLTLRHKIDQAQALNISAYVVFISSHLILPCDRPLEKILSAQYIQHRSWYDDLTEILFCRDSLATHMPTTMSPPHLFNGRGHFRDVKEVDLHDSK